MNDQLSNFKVPDRQAFIQFINLLRQDFLDNSANWENKSLDTFFEAMSSYADDIQGYYNNTNQDINADRPSWQIFADILKGATLYE